MTGGWTAGPVSLGQWPGGLPIGAVAVPPWRAGPEVVG
jgi:hypothetical protein